MKKILINIPILLAVACGVVAISIYLDWGTKTWVWFQRSGSVLVLTGAILGYRSIARLGVGGVGGANTSFVRGKVVSTDSSGPVQRMKIEYDGETQQYLFQAAMDKVAGYIGAILIVVGTLVAGYGDLLGRMQ